MFHARLGVNSCGETASWHSTEDSLLLDVRTPPHVLDSELPKERSNALKIVGEENQVLPQTSSQGLPGLDTLVCLAPDQAKTFGCVDARARQHS